MRNIVDAIIEVINDPKHKLKEYSIAHNRANQMGEALEEYVKDVFAGTVGVDDVNERNKKINEEFCYTGNPNNPPDAMLKGGREAIEVKKIESPNAALALNSSCPKDKLYVDSTMINKACRSCEEWTERDMIYAVGVINGDDLEALAFVYGEDYCASKDTYDRIRTTIKNGVQSIHGVEFAETNELGRVNRVDPLGITYLRVIGMWHIENPFTVFSYIYKRDKNKSFHLMAIINEEKVKALPNFVQLEQLASATEGLEIKDADIKDPNNPAVLKKVKLIQYSIG